MRSTAIIITALCASLAATSPVVVKKALVTDVITSYVFVYVTEGRLPATAPPHTTHKVVPTPAPAPKVVQPSKAVAPNVVQPSKAPAAAAQVVKPSQVAVAAPKATVATAGTVPAAKSFAGVVLGQHNVHRANNSAAALTYDDKIAGYAATVASSCHYAHDQTPGGGGYGQNIAVYGTTANPQAIGASASIAQAITNMWYDGEVELFPAAGYGRPTPDMTNFENWGHYSQVVWKSTTGVGCAAQFCAKGTIFSDMGSWFSVCNYFPAGNVGGEYGANVLPPLGHPTVSA